MHFDLKKFIYFLLPVLIGLIPVFIHKLMTVGNAVTSNDWIGFFGSYTGGIIGGIVAFLVARVQVINSRKDVDKQLDFQKEINSQNKILAERVYLDYTLDIGSLILSEINPENNFILLHSHTGRTIKYNTNEDLSGMKAIFLKTRFYGNASCIMDFSVTIKLKDFQAQDDEYDSNIYTATMFMGGLNNNETVYVPLHMEKEKLSLIYVEFEYTTMGNERIKYISDLLEQSEEYFQKNEIGAFVSLKKKQINNESYIIPGNPLSKN